MHRPRRRPRALAVVSLVCASLLAEPAWATPESGRTDGALNQAMSTLARAFRTRSAETLRTVLPEDGKIFLSLTSLGDDSGYYGPDQVFFIFTGVFTARETIRFDIRPAGPATRGDSTPAATARCAASWSYRGQDGRVGAVRMQFTLNLKHEEPTVSEIREAR